MKARLKIVAVSALSLAAFHPAQAQTVTTFTLTGPIESFKLDPGAAANRGAVISVHGISAVIPNNLIVQMPAAYKTPVEIFNENPKGNAESGLALDDGNKPLAAFEATVIGNIVNGRHIAGLVYVTQHGLANGAGYIKAIDPASGMMRIGSDPTVPVTALDAFVMMNDVDGVFSPALTPAQVTSFHVDSRFTVDEENPTVHAETGYPLCVPGTENAARCPAGNRPLGPSVHRFMMDDGNRVVFGNPSQPGFQTLTGEVIPTCQKAPGPVCDADFEVPLAVGDFVNYAGTLATFDDGTPTGHLYISAHTLIGALGIYTQPATVAAGTPMRAYTAIEVSLIGTMGPPILDAASNAIPMEAQDRLKVEGVSTDPSRPIGIYAIDVKSVPDATADALGSERLRLLATASPPVAVPLGRYRRIIGSRARALYSRFFNAGNPANRLKGAVRELMVHIEDGPGLTIGGQVPLHRGDPGSTPNGLIAGQYIAPVGEFIFPENTGFGDPVIAANFECLPFLVFGNGTSSGPLTPWPGPTPPVFGCGPDPKP
jgi:hypothetical protein